MDIILKSNPLVRFAKAKSERRNVETNWQAESGKELIASKEREKKNNTEKER